MKAVSLLFCAAALLALSACAGLPGFGPTSKVAPPSTAPAAAQPEGAADEPAATQALPPPQENTGSEEDAAGEGGPEDSVLVRTPDGSRWQKPGADAEQQQADIEDCFRYADALVRHDLRIQDDRNAAIDTLTSNSRLTPQRRSVERYAFGQDRAKLMSNCLEQKGYLQL